MKKMQYNAPVTDVKTMAMISMLCASAQAQDPTEQADINFSPTPGLNLTAD